MPLVARRVRLVAGAAAVAAIVAGATVASSAPPSPTRFGAPVNLAPPGAQGFEPRVVADKFGNLYATAAKGTYPAAPDTREGVPGRAASWAWWSSDEGRTWQNITLGPASLATASPGLEGDIATDDTGHVYFLDWNGADVSLNVARAEGRGELRFVHYNPQLVTAGIDDRPWLVAHGNGKVFYFANEGGTTATGSAEPRGGSGRYTVYRSTDHGRTFEHVGYNLPDSGWCRPVADRRPGSRRVVAACTNDADTLFSFVTEDDGATWRRHTIASYPRRPRDAAHIDHYPAVEMARDGTLYALHVQMSPASEAAEVMRLYRSRDGRAWTRHDVTPAAGRFVYAWLAVADDGRLGLATYYKGGDAQPWRVYGAIWRLGQRPRLVLADPTPVAPASFLVPPGDFLTSAFTREGSLAIAYTRVARAVEETDVVLFSVAVEVERHPYFVRSR